MGVLPILCLGMPHRVALKLSICPQRLSVIRFAGIVFALWNLSVIAENVTKSRWQEVWGTLRVFFAGAEVACILMVLLLRENGTRSIPLADGAPRD